MLVKYHKKVMQEKHGCEGRYKYIAWSLFIFAAIFSPMNAGNVNAGNGATLTISVLRNGQWEKTSRVENYELVQMKCSGFTETDCFVDMFTVIGKPDHEEPFNDPPDERWYEEQAPNSIGEVTFPSYQVTPVGTYHYYARNNCRNLVISNVVTLQVVDPCTLVPEPPTLISPSNGSRVDSAECTFTWNETEYATNYDIQIATDTDFSNLVKDQSVGNDNTFVTGGLNHGTCYYWRVRACNSCGCSNYSITYHFINGPDLFTIGSFVPWDGYGLGDGSGFKTGDFNGDAKTDLIHFCGSYVHTWLSNGDGSFSVGTFVPWSGYGIGDGNRFQPGDFNGDGQTDLIHFCGSYVHTWLSKVENPADIDVRANSPVFDAKFYLNRYPDLQQAFGATNYEAAINHWLTHGISEGRASSPAFDVAYYLNRYLDLQQAFGATNYEAAINHWLTHGISEGRASSPAFDVAYYLNRYPDLQQAFGATNYEAAINHWLTHGISEGRVGNAYTITASSGIGGNVSPSGDVTVDYGADRTFTITSDHGYHISDVLVDGASVGAVSTHTFTNVTADHSIETIFAISIYHITASAGIAGSIIPSGSVTVNHGADQTFTITPDDGYDISDVLVDGVSVGAVGTYTFTDITTDHTIEATFDPRDYPVGGDIFVDDDSGDDANDGRDLAHAKKTIQAGIDAASDGEIVVVRDGTYTGSGNKNLNFWGKAFTVRSENGAENTVIDCENDGRGFYFNHNETALSVVEGFTITNGHDDETGGGMYMQNASPTIIDCIFSGNSARYGGAIRCTSSSPTIADCTISGNQASYGGGIGCWTDSSPTITNCTISDNTATEGWGGGIFLSASSPDITDCIISNNTAVQSGGIECTDGSSPTISACTIKGNQAQLGGGIRCYRGAAPAITNCIITGNTASGIGGGIVCQDYAEPFFVNCTIADNEAGSYGGGIVCHGYPSWSTLTNCILWGNMPDEVACGTADITYSDIDQDGYEGSEGNIRLAPLFVDPENGDFRLDSLSPCIDTGGSIEWLFSDHRGSLRPISEEITDWAGFDMGAFEHSYLWGGTSDAIIKGFEDVTIDEFHAVINNEYNIQWRDREPFPDNDERVSQAGEYEVRLALVDDKGRRVDLKTVIVAVSSEGYSTPITFSPEHVGNWNIRIEFVDDPNQFGLSSEKIIIRNIPQ